jgi:hypothetical protein
MLEYFDYFGKVIQSYFRAFVEKFCLKRAVPVPYLSGEKCVRSGACRIEGGGSRKADVKEK